MNATGNRIKAIAVTLLFFAISAFVLLGIVWGIDALPFTVPGLAAIGSYSPHDSIAAVSDLRASFVLTAAYLVATALVVLINTQYCDRMLAILADVLLMMFAAMAGFVIGYWVLLRLAGYQNFLTVEYGLSYLICPAVIFLLSTIPMERLRWPLPLRILTVLALVFAAPIVLLWNP
ncbi:hypothetical protein [Pelagibacterium montanilacus]|uniref:hypothetical protein n=1 Tax=Pelagibacterium montanilacus TaxID=2185280 RepID=UPI000F8E4FDF|nr:hypothetical protein [Pelagibacterium montanilacus]